MPFVEISLDDYQEAQPVPDANYDLRVISCTKVFSKKAKEADIDDPDMYNIIIQVETDIVDEVAPVFVQLAMPGYLPDELPKSAKFKGLQVKRFLHCFSIPCICRFT